jgi:hypothetical protein
MRPRRLIVALSTLSLVAAGAFVALVNSPPAVASDNGLSRTPAMGWSSWSFVRRTPTAAKIIAQADALKANGLDKHGFVYVNLDDFWQKCDANGFTVDNFGRWVVDTAKFPDGLKAVADHVHSLGLKFGVYVTPGIPENAVTKNTPIEGTSFHAKDIADTSKTERNFNCKHMFFINYSKPGAQEYVNSWARLFASYGADYLKIDGVNASDIPDVQAWDKALRASGRPINYALSNNLPIANADTWRQLANSWRTQGDVECYCGPGPNGSGFPLTDWAHVTGRFNSVASWQPFAGPGNWNDYDSLEIGNGDQVGLTADQRRSHMTLWAMGASPFILGTDLTHLDATDVAMLTNDRVIGVDQDGFAAKRISNSGGRQVFSKKESNGSFVVALFNTNTTGNQTVSINWTQVGFSGSAAVTNLWSGGSEGTKTNSYSVSLRPGETRLIRATPGGTPPPPPPPPPPGTRFEAENATFSTGATVDTNHAGFSGTGFVNYVNAVGGFVEWTIPANAAGPATVTIRYANGQSGGTSVNRPMDISVNGGAATSTNFNPTANWDTWGNVTFTVQLNAGNNTIRATATTANGGPNVDFLEVG